MAVSSRQQVQGRKALMWKITTRGFTLQEVLIMAATNIASVRIATDKSERTTTPCTEIQETRGDCYGKGDWVLRTEELSETVEDGGSTATRKNHRVLSADEEISITVRKAVEV